jgi:translocation and assembly module TamB
VQSLTKNGPHWNSRGAAAGVPLNYLASSRKRCARTCSGDLTLGADWALDLRGGTGARRRWPAACTCSAKAAT